jgi:hypothetical protein
MLDLQSLSLFVQTIRVQSENKDIECWHKHALGDIELELCQFLLRGTHIKVAIPPRDDRGFLNQDF